MAGVLLTGVLLFEMSSDAQLSKLDELFLVTIFVYGFNYWKLIQIDRSHHNIIIVKKITCWGRGASPAESLLLLIRSNP